MSKVGFITSKAECEAASLAIKHVTLNVFTASNTQGIHCFKGGARKYSLLQRRSARRPASPLNLKSKVEFKQVNDDNRTRAQSIYLGNISAIYSRVWYSRSVQLRNIGAIYLSL